MHDEYGLYNNEIEKQQSKIQEATNQKCTTIMTSQSKGLKSWEINRAKRKNDLSNYEFRNIANQTLIKPIENLNDNEGQQFDIANCQNCNIFILKHTSNVFIDDCNHCFIYVSPSAGSLFVRDCKNLKLILACQQFRSVKLYDSEILLFCQTQPVIESSDNLKFGCFQFAMQGLDDLFRKAKLQIWNNAWDNIHNFTPNYKSHQNFTFYDSNLSLLSFFPNLNQMCEQEPNLANLITNSEEALFKMMPIPFTEQSTKHMQQYLIMLSELSLKQKQHLVQILNEIPLNQFKNKNCQISLRNTKQINILQGHAIIQQMLANDQNITTKQADNIINKLKQKNENMLFLLFAGNENIAINVERVLQNLVCDNDNDITKHSWIDQSIIKANQVLLFDVWKDKKE